MHRAFTGERLKIRVLRDSDNQQNIYTPYQNENTKHLIAAGEDCILALPHFFLEYPLKVC